MQRVATASFICRVLFCLTTPLSSVAQSFSAIKGTVKDAETGNALPGANVIIEGTSRGASTAGDGGFVIARVRPGNYTLIASIVGYKTASASITVEADRDATVDLQLAPKALELGELLVQADRSYSTASSRAVRDFDLKIRPNRSAQDMLQLAPGLVIAQHAPIFLQKVPNENRGKAEQIFLRGFDADHGTDVNISVDGMPVNMVSHGHGQGYADLHFMIPDVIEEGDVYKGPYFAGQFYNTDGPVNSPQGFRRFNLLGKFHTHVSETAKLSFDISGFSSAWNASGQIPQRAVDNRLIDRFGALDDLEGGTTGRQNLNKLSIRSPR